MSYYWDTFRKWATTISSVFTAIGVLGGFFTYYNHIEDGRRAILNVQILHSRSDKMAFFFSNQAGSDLAIKSIELHLNSLNMNVSIPYNSSFAYFPAHTSKILTSSPVNLDFAIVASNKEIKDKKKYSTSPCTLRVRYLSSMSIKTQNTNLALQCINADIYRP